MANTRVGESLFRKKDIPSLQRESEGEGDFRRTLGVWSLTAIGVGAIVGVGAFVLLGVAAATEAGPAVALSFVAAGVAAAAAALCYAELAGMIPVSGSAYTYSYAVMGEFLAWLIGWNLLLEYTLVVAVVAIGIAGYLNEILNGIGLVLPAWTSSGYFVGEGGVVNLFAGLLCLFIAGLQIRGIEEGARFNTAMVVLKVSIIIFVVIVGAFYVDPSNLVPFFPFGISGVLGGAALVFFAVFGFDAMTTAAEESRNPQRDLPRAVLLSLAIALVLYVLLSLVVTGIVPYEDLNTPTPVTDAFREADLAFLALIVAVAAVASILSVLFAFMLSSARIWFAISRDGLLPRWFARPHPRFRTPYRTTIIIGVLTAAIAGLFDIESVAELVNIGGLSSFIVVCAAVWILRRRSPEIERGFRTPLVPLVPIVGILVSLVLIASLPGITWVRFAAWLGIGAVIYFAYGRRHSRLATERDAGL